MSFDISNITVPVICGPTAVGKSSLAMKIAEEYGYEIISADSRQTVRRMDIGTAKPSAADQSKIPHHFIDIIDPDNDIYNSYIFGNEVREKLSGIYRGGRKALICGGSGLYIQSAVHGFFDDLGIDDTEKLEYRKTLESLPLEECYEKLKKADPEYASQTPPGQKQRIHRALEVFHFTGRRLSELHREHSEHRYFKPLYIGLNTDREKLYDIINTRVVNMIEAGLIDEVEMLISEYGADLKRFRKTIGYREVIDHLKGSIDKDTMIDEIRKNTRHFAKRQITWFKRIQKMQWYEPENFGEVKKSIV